jgi:hypothetical protein
MKGDWEQRKLDEGAGSDRPAIARYDDLNRPLCMNCDQPLENHSRTLAVLCGLLKEGHISREQFNRAWK